MTTWDSSQQGLDAYQLVCADVGIIYSNEEATCGQHFTGKFTFADF
jgi:hypothetical protein